jgi:hypothetical protein
MVKAIHLKADVPKSREVRVVLPPEVPTGPADLVVLVASGSMGNGSTLGDLLDSSLFGAWKD